MKNIFIKISNWIAVNLDKFLHIGAGAIISYIVLAILVLTNSMLYFSLFACISVLVAFGAGILKEVLDARYKKEKEDTYDIIATVIGAILNVAIIVLTKLIFV